MIDYEEEREFVVESAIKNNLGSKEEIELYEQLSLALELNNTNNSYDVIDSGIGIGNGIDFSITTQYPDGLPENIGTMFFNVSNDFNVNIVEISQCAEIDKRFFKINLKSVTF